MRHPDENQFANLEKENADEKTKRILKAVNRHIAAMLLAIKLGQYELFFKNKKEWMYKNRFLIESNFNGGCANVEQRLFPTARDFSMPLDGMARDEELPEYLR